MKAAARKAAPPPLGAPVDLRFGEIVGIDPCNARRIEPGPALIADLAHSIAERGLLNPLIVRGSPNAWRVLAGGCRWRALKSLLRPSDDVRCRAFRGDDDAAADLSLDENVDRGDLHPLDLADRVAEMAHEIGVAAVARRRGRSDAWVRQRLALSGLPEAARLAWLEGRVEEAGARALTVGAPDAVEALLARDDAANLLADPRRIRDALNPRGVRATSELARFVGEDAYLAAGGEIVRDLFGEGDVFADGELLRRLRQARLAAEAEKVCEAEGWGTAILEGGAELLAPQLLPGERETLARIEGRLEAEDTADDAEAAALDQQAQEIRTRGVLRAVAKDERARLGVLASVRDGRVVIERGAIVGGVAPGGRVQAVDAAASSGGAATRRDAAVPSAMLAEEAKRLARRAAARAIAGALCDPASRLDDKDALRILLAGLSARGPERGPVLMRFGKGPGGARTQLLRDVARGDFAAALAACVAAEDADLVAAQRALVGMALDLGRAVDAENAALWGFASRRDPGLGLRFSAELDYPAYFRAAGRPASLDAIRACAGPAAESERAWMNDDALSQEAALLARAKCWIPDFLGGAP